MLEWMLFIVILLKIYGPMIIQGIGAIGLVFLAYYLLMRGIL